MVDPLAGMRRKISAGDISVLRWPAKTDKAPVAKGDRFTVGSSVIVIETVSRKLPAGKPAEWHASFVRIVEDKPQLLRRVPSGLPTPSDRLDGRSVVERARVESAYTSSARMALVDEPESVGPDWKDPGVAEREKNRQEAVKARMSEERVLREATNLAARVKQEVIERGSKGEDLTHLLADVYARLAKERKEAA